MMPLSEDCRNQTTAPPCFENLEERLLLTTLLGGDVFEYFSASEQTVRIVLEGDIIAEFIAADIDQSSNAIVTGDMPGRIYTSTTGREGTNILGGVGGADGVELLGEIKITDVDFSSGTISFNADGVDEITLNALASMDEIGNGDTYAINIAAVTVGEEDRTIIQLLKLDTSDPDADGLTDAIANVNADVRAMLQQASLKEDIMAALSIALGNVGAFAVDPTDGTAFAVNEENGQSLLYSINRITGTVALIGTTIINTTTGNPISGVEAMAFDSTGQLYILTQDYDGDTGNDASGLDIDADGNKSDLDTALVALDKTNAQFVSGDATSILINGLEANNVYAAMVFQDDSTVLASARVVDGENTTSRLHSINVVDGVTEVKGEIKVGDSTATVIDGFALAVDSSGATILVGADNGQSDEGTVLPRLVRIATTNGAASPLCEAGAVEQVGGLGSYIEPGDTRLLLFAAAGDHLFRGSAVTLPLEDGATKVDSIAGADFRPRTGAAEDGLLYFVARYTNNADQDVDRLYTINVTAANRSAIQNSLTSQGNVNEDEDFAITSIAWEQTGATTAELVAYQSSSDAGQIVTIAGGSGSVNVTLAGEAVTNITAIEFVRDDPTVGETYIYAVSNSGADSQLLRINRGTGGAYVLGPLSDPDDLSGMEGGEGPIRGEDLQGIAWNPILRNPFTGEIGVLLGTDASSDELVYIDDRPRFPTADIFAIYIAQTSEDASISMAIVPDFDPDDPSAERFMEPFTGNVGDLRVIPAQDTGGDRILVSTDNTGGVYIGAMTEDINPDVDDEDRIPILRDIFFPELGVRPAEFNDFGSGAYDLSAGVRVVDSLLSYVSDEQNLVDRFLQNNLDDVQGIAVKRDGSIVVVDSDGLNGSGLEVAGDTLCSVDGTTGLGSPGVVITSATTGIALSGIQGLDYGDIDFDGVEELYAIMNVNDANPTMSIGGDLGDDLDIVGLTVTPGNVMYAVDDRGGAGTTFDLYRIDRDTAGAVTAFELIGEIEAEDAGGLTLVTDISAIEADPVTGELYIVGLDGAGDQTLFTVAIVGANGKVLATAVAALDGGGVTDTIKALAFAPGGDLYAVRDEAGADTLYTIDTETAALTEVDAAGSGGAIEVAAAGTNIEEMDFLSADVLIGIDSSLGAGQRRLVLIDLDTPTASTQLSAPGTVDDDLRGYASDRDGYFYSVYDDDAADNEVYVSGGDLPTLGTLNEITRVFTPVGTIGGGTISSVLAMAFSPGAGTISSAQQGLYIVDGNNRLYEIDPTSGGVAPAQLTHPVTFDQFGYLLQDSGGATIAVGSMDFDAGGSLFAHDVPNGRLVDIDLTTFDAGADADSATVTVGDSTATTSGSLRPTVGAISYDWANRRFLAVDNATGSLQLANEDSDNAFGPVLESSVLMELLGTTSTSAAGGLVDNLLIGGAVTGLVNTSGSFGTFYAGWLLTGATGGQGESAATVPDNFFAAGDVRNLIVNRSIGTHTGDDLDEPTYMTGFDLDVGGKLGQLWTLDSFIGGVDVENQESIANLDALTAFQYEIEARTTEDNPVGRLFQNFELYNDDGSYDNDSFDSAQYLGSIRSGVLGNPDVIRAFGNLYGEPDDFVDYYAVSLMAGQTVTVELNSGMFFYLGVFDPDGRLIATDYSDVDPSAVQNAEFHFTADRPGAYRFAVAMPGDTSFIGDPSLIYLDSISYVLSIDGAGDIGIGGVIAANNIFNAGEFQMFSLTRGDLGAIVAGDKFFSEGFGDVAVSDGNLRAIVAGSIGMYSPDDEEEEDGTSTFEDGIWIEVTDGSAGLLRTTADDGVMFLLRADIGGDMQMIDAKALLWLDLEADGGLGVLRAGAMNTNPASIISVNADGVGHDGIIDLIDVEGNLGAMNPGGPEITTGIGGNVRYMRVGGDVYQDSFFGGGEARTSETKEGNPITAPVTITDDSGAKITLTPLASVFDPLTGQAIDTPTMTYLAYGIRNSGGSALIDVTSTGGLKVTSNSMGNNYYAEIGRIEVAGDGRPVEVQPDGSLALADDEGINLNVKITGSANNPVDVFEIVGGNFTRISNYTGGEIVNIVADTIGSLDSYGPIGLAKTYASTVVNPLALGGTFAHARLAKATTMAGSFPFVQQHTGIVSGDIVMVRTTAALGNFIVDGNINWMYANRHGTVDHTDGVFNGIAAPIYLTGDLGHVMIGEGIAPTGSGDVAYAGLFAEGTIGKVVNQGVGSNIWGTIAGEEGVESISVSNGSIINANIACIELEDTREFATNSTSSGDIGNISVVGEGGIIGLFAVAQDIGNTNVSGGFGIFNSIFNFASGGSGALGNTTVGGLGIRGVLFRGGSSEGNITATGRGATVSTLGYAPTVRYSENYEYDPLFGMRINRTNDIHEYLGTSIAAPDETEGIVSNVHAMGSGGLGVVTGYQINDTQLDFANSIVGVKTLDTVTTLEITTGKLGYFKPASDVSGLDMNVAGRISNITIKGDLLSDANDPSTIIASGPNGDIRYVRVTGDMDGSIIASGTIGTIIIGGDLNGSIVAEATNGGREALRLLKLGGTLSNAALDINGNVGTIDIGGDMGVAGDTLLVNGNLRTLKVGTNKTVDGSSLMLDLRVLGNLNALDVTGKIEGDIFVAGMLNRMTVKADAVTIGTDIVSGDITVLGEARSVTITNGNLASNFTAGDTIGTFRITNGDIAAGAALTSSFGDIRSVYVRNGDVNGSIAADNGTIKSITVLGSDLGALSSISARELASLRVDGSILTGAAVAVAGELGKLNVGVDVQAGATITAGSSRDVRVGNDFSGAMTLGYGKRGTKLYVGRDLGATAAVDIDADTRLTVRRDIVDGGTVLVGRDMTSMTVTGTVFGDVIVDGSARTMRAGALSGAVITTGLDLQTLYVTGAVGNTLVQVGISRGDDNAFATGDLNETGRMAKLTTLTIRGAMSNSIVAAGGEIFRATVTGGMTNSSISSGLSLGNAAVAAVLADGTPLASAGEQNAARNGADRALYCGNFGNAVVNGVGLVSSDLTAGVDAGDGDFGTAGDNSVVVSETGGNSSFRSVRGTLTGGSTVLADGGISTDRTTVVAGTVTPNVAYAIADITTNNALETLVGTAVQAAPLSYVTIGGFTVTITVRGNGAVAVHDEAGADTDDKIDTLVITGTDRSSRVTIETSTPGAVSIGRIITGDDAQLHTLTFDGDLVGEGTDDRDLWIDGPIGTLTFRDMGDAFDGQIGGDVTSLTLRTQGSGDLRIGGRVRKMTIAGSGTDPLLNALGAAPSSDIGSMTTDSAGNVWVFDTGTGNLSEVNVNTGVVLTGPLAVTEAFSGVAVTLTGMDFDTADVLYGIGSLYSQSPTQLIGSISGAAITLVGMTVDSTGRVVAVQNVGGVDRLVSFDTATGAAAPIGTLQDIFANTYNNNVLALAFDDGGTLLALVNDLDGSGGAYAAADGVTLLEVETSDGNGDGFLRVTSPTSNFLPGVLLDGGAVLNSFNAMAVDSGGTFYAIRRDLADTQDELVTIATDGTVTLVGVVQVGAADTDIVGMGFDESGNLVAYNNDGATAELIAVNTITPGTSARITAAGVLDTTIDAFAVGRSGANFTTYAYDSGGSGVLYTNPGTIQTLGTINTATGDFTQFQGLAQDAAGTPLSSTVVGLAVDIFSTTDDVFVVTADGRLVQYSETDAYRLDGVIGTIADVNSGDTLNVSSMDFNDATGVLIGLDARFNRLVSIATGTALATPLMEAGAADGTDLAALTYDTIAAGFYSFSDSADQFMQFRGTSQDALGGIVANTIDGLTLAGGYGGRIVTTGNSFGTVNVTGAFAGSLITAGDIKKFTQTGGDFSGVLRAGGDISYVRITGGGILQGGSIEAMGYLGTIYQIGGDLAGFVSAQDAGTLRFGGAGEATADLLIAGSVANVVFTGGFAGQVEFGSVRTMTVGGLLGGTADIEIHGDAATLKLYGGTDTLSIVVVDGYVRSLTVGGTHRGDIAIRQGMRSGRLAAMDYGILVVGEDTGSLNATDVVDSVISIGTWVGDDHLYNTDDDVITGGSARSISIMGNFQDSVIAAGVLPSLAYGSGMVADNRAYTGNSSASNIAYVDSAEAGGVLDSVISRLTIRGNVINTSPSLGYSSAVVAADGIGRVSLSMRGATLATRVYGDTFGPPTVDRSVIVNDSEAWIILSEGVNSASLILSQDLDDDGTVTGAADVLGTVLLVDENGVVVDDVTLSYTTQTQDDGTVEGVLIIRRDGGFGSSLLTATLSGSLMDPAVYDRSGMRSALRDLNQDGTADVGEDLPGTILDGNTDGDEGGNAIFLIPFGDMPDTFHDAADGAEIGVTLDGGTLTAGNAFASFFDVDVYRFTADAFDFFAAEYTGEALAKMALFLRDDQGTPLDSGDDFFETLARYEADFNAVDLGLASFNMFSAFELPTTGEYFLVVEPDEFVTNSIYTLELTLSSSDALLVTHIGGALPTDETIAYVSDKIGDNNNALGANTPRQLVYLDFDGGTTTKYAAEYGSEVTVEAFDLADVDVSLDGEEDRIINGGDGVVGIVDNMITIFSNTPASHPDGQLNVARITTQAEWDALVAAETAGLYFTTVDPATWAVPLDPDTDFTTVFIGEADTDIFNGGTGLGGIASDIDVANMSKSDNGIVFAQNFNGASTAGSTTARLTEYSRLFANISAHELGHTLGLNHQPTYFGSTTLLADDPDNNPATTDDSNTGEGLMAYPSDRLDHLNELGTLGIAINEFSIGQIDTADLLVRWLS